ncbi:amino acid--tRNA ligase-related protein [Streptomyces heilongjiangensis]|uniref:Amino acid--tRNA ligase-related protein n=1 Tax=Streptomyces heilongjiangensis TaxID=945052 RepID=A0ABW1BET5_9ACTN|nr:amino acid--tRNA ligase-related protein [Streptomyces heilongjiangensis]MDC2950184.1 OB-fold nucleic acid binding domain-containing protein [Streptomyces heilongjiangensis]
MHRLYDGLLPGTATGDTAVLVGRVVAHRAHGGMGFVDLADSSGDIQLILSDDTVESPGLYARWQADVDLGDHVGVTGEVVTSRTGALSLRVTRWELATKALRPLPGPARARHRSLRTRGPQGGERLALYQRMMLDRREAARFRGRAAVLRAVRDELHSDGYVEADTPLLHPVPGGTARPFRTMMNAWRIPLYLRGSTELYLKRLVIGGAERVFELGHVFRNEGTGVANHPEFTVCEGYAAHTDYTAGAETVERLVRAAATAVQEAEGPTRVTRTVLGGSGDRPDQRNRPFTRVTLHRLLSESLGAPVASDTSAATFAHHARRLGLDAPAGTPASALALLLFRKVVRPTLTEPTFVLDLPSRAARFARPCSGAPDLVEAWSLVLAGTDIGQGCTELTDPVEQRHRLTEQQREPGLEHLLLDEDFLAALEHGLPPLGGFSLGVDRLIGALRDDGRRLSDQQCLALERVGTRGRTDGEAPGQGAEQETDRSEAS